MGAVDLDRLRGRRVLLVGGTGFIGRQVLPLLLDHGAHVTVMALFSPEEVLPDGIERCDRLTGDIRRPAVREVIAATSWDIVINLGGHTAHDHDAATTAEMREVHFAQVCELVACLPDGLQRFVQAGSALEYGDAPAPHHEALRERPLNPYAAAKVACTHHLQMLQRGRGFPAVVLRPFYPYGPGQDQGRFLAWAAARARAGEPIEMTPGEQTRDPVHVDDVARAFVHAAVADGVQGQVINVASGAPITLGALVELVVEVVGRGTVRRGARPYRRGEVMRSEADISRLRELLRIEPSTALRDNLAYLAQGGS